MKLLRIILHYKVLLDLTFNYKYSAFGILAVWN